MCECMKENGSVERRSPQMSKGITLSRFVTPAYRRGVQNKMMMEIQESMWENSSDTVKRKQRNANLRQEFGV